MSDFNRELDDLFKDLDLPSDKEITEETRRRKSALSRIGLKKSQETIEKIRQSNRGQKRSDETRNRLSASKKEQFKDPEFVKKHREASIASKKVPGYVEKQRESALKREENPDYVQNRLAGIARREQNEEYRKKRSEAVSKKMSDPEYQQEFKQRRENNSSWLRKRCRPVSTPYGIFLKVNQVVDLIISQEGGVFGSVQNRVGKWLKSDDHPDWRYLIWEEYDKLTK